MTDVASLSFQIDSSNVPTATDQLNKLSDAADHVRGSVRFLVGAVGDSDQALQQLASSGRASLASFVQISQNLDVITASLTSLRAAAADTIGTLGGQGLNSALTTFQQQFAAMATIFGTTTTQLEAQVARRYKTSIIALDRVMGRIPVNEIDGTVISEFISARRCQVSNATIRRDLTALSSLLTACGSWGWVKDGNVAAKFDRKIVKERRELISMMDRDALGRVMDELPGSMADLLTLLDQTGMRLNEAVTLERWQLDYDKGQVYLDKTKTNRPRVISFKTAGGDAGPLLAKYKDAKGQLFTNRNGDTYQNFSSNFGQVIRRLIARAKAKKRPFKRFRVHDLRHMFAIRWLQNFGNIYKLQKHLGHTSVKTTEMYLEYVGEKEQEAARFGLTGVFSETAQMTAQPESKAGRSTKPKQNNVGI